MCVPSNYTYLALFRLNVAVLSLCALLLLGACSPERSGQTTNSHRSETEFIDSRPIKNPSNEVQIRWTTYGIPHVKADSWEGLGYGFAHAIATNTICVLAREFVTVRGEQSKYFGATESSINANAFHRALLNPSKIDEYLAYGSVDTRAMNAGYVSGYNNFIKMRAGTMPASCNNAPWITPHYRTRFGKNGHRCWYPLWTWPCHY